MDAVSSNDFSNDAIGAAPSRFCFRASISDANSLLDGYDFDFVAFTVGFVVRLLVLVS